jgi:hypothetical protein
MSREHLEFIQSQRLRWRRGLPGGARPEVDVRVLSADPQSGASSLVVRYPAGWNQSGEQRLAADEELFVLDGELLINDRRFGLHSYAYLPAGYRRLTAVSPAGAVVLTFFSATPSLDPSLPDPNPVATGLVEYLDVVGMPWEFRPHAQMRPGCGRKSLRQDPRTGDETWLLTSPPHGVPPGGQGAQETHPTVEEVFVLIGDLHGNCGVMRPGAYFWRPPGILHGPYGSRLGATSLYRTKGGPLVGNWTTEKIPFRFDPPYHPVIPASLELLPEPGTLEVKSY